MDRAELRRLAEAVSKFYDNPVYSTNESGVWDKYIELLNPAAIIKLLDEIAVANARIAELESKCETCFSNYAKATGKLADRAEAAESECRRLRVCGNCRHYSQGYTDDYCVKDCSHGEKETRRGNTCNDWEMI